MLLILNKILNNQLDPAAVMSKLDEIASGVKDIQHRTADRVLTDAQGTTLVQALSKSPQSISVVLLGDREANAYGQQIIGALREAGWRVSINSIGVMGPPAYGVSVAGNTELESALVAAGIEVTSGQNPPFGSALLIGLKPY